MRNHFAAFVTAGALLFAGCGSDEAQQPSKGTSDAAPTVSEDAAREATTPAPQLSSKELMIEVIKEGEGDAIEAGQVAVVHYTGWFYDESADDNRGDKFDSSRDRGDTFDFRLGAGSVIEGWDQGVEGMKQGERRILTVPPELAYGERGHPAGIPPNSTLVFDVELVEIR